MKELASTLGIMEEDEPSLRYGCEQTCSIKHSLPFF